MQNNGGYLIGQISKLTNRRINEFLKEENITEFNAAQGTILYVLAENGPMQIKEIGEETGLAKTSLTSMLERMEEQGLITKTENDADRRSTIVSLSERAQSYKPILQRMAEKIDDEYYRGMKEKEIDRFKETLQKILRNLEAED